MSMASRSYSIRTRVAVASALVTTAIIIIIGVIAGHAMRDNNLRQVDRKLEAVAAIGRFTGERATTVARRNGLAVSVYEGDRLVGGTTTRLPLATPGWSTITVGSLRYRVLTITREQPPHVVSLGVPLHVTDEETKQQRRWIALACLLAILAATFLGWLIGGLAVRPIIDLTRRVSAHPNGLGRSRSGVREADELADAVATMLEQVSEAQNETAATLSTARDFAAAAAHELRTPLTAMRTDLEVLRTLNLNSEERAEILADLQRTQGRVEATLTALERLATGELISGRDYTDTDLGELCDLAAHDAMRHNPGLTVRVEAEEGLIIRGLPAGLRLAVDNAITNSVRHGNATLVALSAHRDDTGVAILIDDNGSGIPEDERQAVFARFVRGRSAAKGGSGLGLALVAQQAQLHGGTAAFTQSPLGGARLTLTLSPT